MKLMFASDIHGSLDAAEKTITAFDREKADKLFLLGDLLYHGPRNDLPVGYNPKGVISLLNLWSSSIVCVRGNCDADVDKMVLNFPIDSESVYIYADGLLLYLTHGHNFSADNLPPLASGCAFMCGHTHIGLAEKREDRLLLNPGSPAIPKDNRPSYMVYEDGLFALKSLDGDVYKTVFAGVSKND